MIRFLKNLFHIFEALLACIYYGFPASKLKVIGVTGTSGKTTTTHLIYEVLKRNGLPVSMLSTIKAEINGNEYDTGFHVTTPSSWQLQKFLKEAKDGGSQYFVLEITSHALDQFRTWGVPIEIAVITNITHEHLDYHGSIEDYRKAKSKILNGAAYAILNLDDKNFPYLSKRTKANIISYGIKSRGEVSSQSVNLNLKIPGEYNLYNGLAAFAVAKIVNIPLKKSIKALNDFPGLPGRMEEIETGKNFRIIIDFAHKPDALEAVLKTIRKTAPQKLIAVFGCAGLRDRLKRPIMGQIAGKYADFTVLTAEDPRTEDVRDIISEIASGMAKVKAKEINKRNFNLNNLDNGKYFIRIPDRQEAINFSIRQLAQKGDVLILCGKGHEKSMCYGKTEYPWDEKKAIEKALK